MIPTGRAPFLFLLALLLIGCTQAQRENAAKRWCDSAPNCTVYDESGKPTSRDDYCEGSDLCGGSP